MFFFFIVIAYFYIYSKSHVVHLASQYYRSGQLKNVYGLFVVVEIAVEHLIEICGMK